MISRLEIKGFKSLVDVSIELGAVNVFIGANGSGKSNLLEAVGVLSAIVSGGLEAESIRYRGVRLGMPASFQSSLLDQSVRTISMLVGDDETCYTADFGPDAEHPSSWSINDETIIVKGNEVLKRTIDSVTMFAPMEKGGFDELTFGNRARSRSTAPLLIPYFRLVKVGPNPERIQKEIVASAFAVLETLEKYSIFSPSTPQLRGFLDDIHRDPVGLGGSGLGQAIDEMTKSEPGRLGPFDLEDVYELIDWAESLQTVSGVSVAGGPTRLRIVDRFMADDHKSVSLLEASEGALYVLFMLALVGHPESPKIFAVDNFDQSLHPRLACALTRLISEQIVDDGSRQMLATTHNPLVLDGLDLLDDRIRLFTVDRNSTGASQVKRVLVTEELIEKGFSLSRLWTMGRLGGVPRAL